MDFNSLYTLLEAATNFDDLTVVKTTVESKEAKSILNKYAYDMQVYQRMIEKGMADVKRDAHLYYDGKVFIGFCVYLDDYYLFDENRMPMIDPPNDATSAYRTLHIANLQIRDSIRLNKENPRYGSIILNGFIKAAKQNGYAAVTLQAYDDFLLNHYTKYGFEKSEELGANAMVRWL